MEDSALLYVVVLVCSACRVRVMVVSTRERGRNNAENQKLEMV